MRTALFVLLWVLFGGARAAEPVEQNLILGQGDQALYGSLLLPAGAAKPLVALIISGSGPTDRDGNSLGLPGKNNSLKLLAEGLAREGIASLRYDKRGVAASIRAATSEADLRFDHFAADAAAWIELLRRDGRFGGVAVIGHSEGAALGALAAQRGGVVAYVSLAGPGRDAAAGLRGQFKGKLPPDLAERNEQILQSLQRGETVPDTPPALAAFYRPSVQPYLISWFKVDPAREVAKLKMPVAVAQGTTDIQVSMADAELIGAAKPDAKLLRIEGMNHVLKAVSGTVAQQMPSYSDPALPLAPGLVEGLVAFLKRAMP